MKYDPDKHTRHSIRLTGYDYTQPGVYFVTICTHQRECLLGKIVDGLMSINCWGEIVQEEWLRTAILRPGIELGVFVVMPNHFHGIISITSDCRGTELIRRGTARRAPTREQFGRPIAGSVPTLIRAFKSATTKRINERRGTPGTPVWQRNYYEHIIRKEEALNRAREYIALNPSRWQMDCENPQNR
jgi:REP element-mobilizing transposase RayT